MFDGSSLRVKLSDPASGKRSSVWITCVGRRRRRHCERIDERARLSLKAFILHTHSITQQLIRLYRDRVLITITSANSYNDYTVKEYDLK